MLSICAALSMSVGALIASDARAADVCNTLSSPTGNIVVPEDATCTLSFVIVNGNINAQSGSFLILRGVTVNGNLSSHGGAVTALKDFGSVIHGSVDIDSNTVTVFICSTNFIFGNVTISNTNPGQLVFGCELNGTIFSNSVFFGSVSITNNDASSMQVVGNSVDKNMTITNNKGSGAKVVTFNGVGGNLECFGNQTPFTIGTGPSANAALKLIGQCAPPPQ
jgi:hypothetical protein